MQINCFATDKFGQIWYGTQRGLYSFDGYTSRQRTTFNSEIYSICIANNILIAGTDNGLLTINLVTGEQNTINSSMGTVRCIKHINNAYYIGAQNGLFIFDEKNISEITPTKGKLPNKTIYSIEYVADTLLYIGTYNGLCQYTINSNQIQQIELPKNKKRQNCFVNSLFWNNDKQQLYIGTEGELFIKTSNEPITHFNTLSGNSIKSLATDINNNLLVGTDNGLYIISTANIVQHIIHDVHNSTSLAGNNIWSILSTYDGSVWLGTDNGISYTTLRSFYISISDITHSTQGNTITTILQDKHKNLWLGGTNGLIRTNHNFSTSIWYSQSDSNYKIPHNHVRKIYEDQDGDLWIATDGGVLRYDYDKEQFITYNLTDSTKRYNANWVYDIRLTDNNQLWIATCRGGVMVIDKQKLLCTSPAQNTYIVEQIYTEANGLSSDYAERILQVNTDTVIVMMHDGSIFSISNNNVTQVENNKFSTHSNNASYTDSTQFYLGGIDEIFCASHAEMNELKNSYLPYITDVLINEKSIFEKSDIRYTNHIEISEDDNDIAIEISNYNYSDSHNICYAYRINELNDTWHILPKGDNQLHLIALPHGTYNIHIAIILSNDISISPQKLTLTILPPWYRTSWAISIYIIIIISLLTLVLYILQVRHNIELERQERNNALEQAHLKLDFYSHVSSDLKSPLSLIIGQLNTIISKTENTELRTDIAATLTNARQLNKMIGLAFFTNNEESLPSTTDDHIRIITQTQDERFLSQIVAIIDENMGNPDFNVNALADKLCMSQKQLYRRIKTITNQTPIEYISGIRMKRAALLLSQGSFTVAEVMYMVGHTNHSYFAKCFSAAYGMPPKMYAQQQKETK